MTETATRPSMREGEHARDASVPPAPLDIIFVRDIRLETLIGAYEFERRQPRTLQVNIDIGRRALLACKSDQLADTIDYSDVVGAVREVFASHAFHLLEPLAEMIADTMLTRFDAAWTSVEISKTGIVANAREVGVRIERSRGAAAHR